MAKSRISRVDDDSFDPAFGWETINFPDPTAYSSTHPSSPGTPYAPSSFQHGSRGSSGGHGHRHSHSRTEEFSRTRHGEPVFSSPEISPQIPAIPEDRIPESLRITSPLSPTFSHTGSPSLNPPYAAASAQTYGFQTNSHKRRSAIGDSVPQPPPPTVGGYSNNGENRNSGAYNIPAPPPPPTVPMDFDDTDYERVRLTEHNRISHEGHSRNGGYLGPGGWGGPHRQPSMAKRLGEKILGTVKGRGPGLSSRSYKGTIRDRGGGYGDGRGEGDYAKVDERDDEEPVGYDISSFGADFIPAPAVRAMEDYKMDADYAYTGEFSWLISVVLVGVGGDVGLIVMQVLAK